MLKNHNDEMTEERIRAMSHDELVQAVIRMLNVEYEEAEQWRGAVCIPDKLADAFRGVLANIRHEPTPAE